MRVIRYVCVALMFVVFNGSITSVSATGSNDNRLNDTLYVYIVSGQSNASGLGNATKINNPIYQNPQKDVLFYQHRIDGSKQPLPSDKFIDLEPGSGYGSKGLDITEFGPEVALGRHLADIYPDRKILIFKCAKGSTSLHGNWLQGKKCYVALKKGIDEMKYKLNQKGTPYKMMGFVWTQGETDAKPENGSGAYYKDELKDFIECVRVDFFDGRQAPFVLSRLSDNQYGSMNQGVQTVRKAQTNMPGLVGNVATIDTDDDDLYTAPNIHFDANGLINIGKAFADKLKDLSNDATAIALENLNAKNAIVKKDGLSFIVTRSKISIVVPVESNLSISIYSMTGKKVATLHNGNAKVGVVEVPFNSANLASGIYSVAIKTGDFVSVQKLLFK